MGRKRKNGEILETHQDTEAEEVAKEVDVVMQDQSLKSLDGELTLQVCIALVGKSLDKSIRDIDVMISILKEKGKSCQRFVTARYDLQRMQKHLK